MWPTEQNLEAWEHRYGARDETNRGLPEAVRERLPDLEGKHVMHLPCGTGEIAAELVELGALVTGIDPSEAKPRRRPPARARRGVLPGRAGRDPAPVPPQPLHARLRERRHTRAGPRARPVRLGADGSAPQERRLILLRLAPGLRVHRPDRPAVAAELLLGRAVAVGQVAVAFGSSLDVTEIEELPPDAAAARSTRACRRTCC